jgi:hypothetical protein
VQRAKKQNKKTKGACFPPHGTTAFYAVVYLIRIWSPPDPTAVTHSQSPPCKVSCGRCGAWRTCSIISRDVNLPCYPDLCRFPAGGQNWMEILGNSGGQNWMEISAVHWGWTDGRACFGCDHSCGLFIYYQFIYPLGFN